LSGNDNIHNEAHYMLRVLSNRDAPEPQNAIPAGTGIFQN